MANGHEEVSWLDWPEPISYEKGEIFFEDWEIGEELGRGASGSVYLLTKEPMGLKQESAMKVVHLTLTGLWIRCCDPWGRASR